MRALVTGASGFVGRYLVNHLHAHGYKPVTAGREDDGCDVLLELHDGESMATALEAAEPDVIFHLAAQTFVPAAAQDPVETYETNVIGTARLIQATVAHNRRRGKRVKMVFISSAQVYGPGNDLHGALDESAPLMPVEPYSASKAAAEYCCNAAYHTYDLDVVIARAFNHIGIGQDRRFVVSSMAYQLAAIAHGIEKPLLEMGNLEAERDFLDVRDVVEAYIAVAERGLPGSAYNVCSGQPVKIKTILAMLIRQAHVPVEVREDPAKMRPVDVPRFYGNNSRLKALGWNAIYPLEQSVAEIYRYAAEHVSATA